MRQVFMKLPATDRKMGLNLEREKIETVTSHLLLGNRNCRRSAVN